MEDEKMEILVLEVEKNPLLYDKSTNLFKDSKKKDMWMAIGDKIGVSELPYGWEKIDDPIYGSYYVDHINRRTQFENPVLEAKRRLHQQQMPNQDLPSQPLQAVQVFREKPLFTRDATQLKGTFLSTALQKSSMGFGFTIIGGDDPDEFLQVKSVIPDGPAAQDGKMDTVLSIILTCSWYLPAPRGEEPPLPEPRGVEPPLPEPRGEAKSIPPPQPRPPPLRSSPVSLRPVPCPLLLDTLPAFLDLPVLDLEPRSLQHWPQLCPWFPAPLSPSSQTSLGCCQTSLLLPLFAASLPLGDRTSLHRFPGEDLCPLWGPFQEAPEGPTHPQARPWKRAKIKEIGLEGDVIVYINDVCVLGHTHADVVKLFQSVPIGQSVNLVLCRGYPLPYDPEDPSSSMISPMGIMERPPVLVNGRSNYDNYMEYISRTSRYVQDHTEHLPQQPLPPHPADGHPDGPLLPPVHEDNVSMASSGATQSELMTITIVKGAEGFGFTIADSPTGQRVKQILDVQGCLGLCEGDLIVEINQQNVQSLSHAQVVDLLKECPVGSETSLIIQRGGGHFSPWKTSKQVLEQWDIQGSPQTSLSAPVLPQNVPFPPNFHRASFPDSADGFDQRKPEPYDLYEKSRAIYESRLFHDMCVFFPISGPDYRELDVHLRRQKSGFGFRILGGDEPGQPIVIGAIIEKSSADRDGRLQPGDELLFVDGIPTAGKTHRYVIDLMHGAARNGQVNLIVRRKVQCVGEPCPENGKSPGSVSTQHSSPRSDFATYPNNTKQATTGASPPEGFVSQSLQTNDVIIHRKENEGFGFVIISSLNRPEAGSTITVPHKIGRIIEGSPADRCGKLKVGDRILAVNSQSIINMPHADIVKLIKDAGLSVTLRIIPQEELNSPASTASSEKQSPKAQQHSPMAQQSPVAQQSEPCPENGKSPGSVSTQHSSPRSDFATYPNNTKQATTGASPPEGFVSQSLQTNDVIIHRKENEGFGFVIISSLNRPEAGSTITVPHKIGRLIEGSPADRCGKLKVGDRILAVNSQSIINMPHADIVKLIKDAGLSVTLRIIPQEELNSPASTASSEKQSPKAQQHSPMAQQSPVAQQSPATHHSPVTQLSPPPPQLHGHGHDSRSEVKARQDVKPDIRQPPFTDYRQPPVDYRQPPAVDYRQPPTLDYRQPPIIDYRLHSPDTRQYPAPDYRQPQDFSYFTVELDKSMKGFGFSIRGGREYKMDLYVLRLAEDGPAIRNGRMRVRRFHLTLVSIETHSTP
ncbi:UNVERIFIED_CONTAM: hypothetical protein FKN15_004560 [Acipenser sinensis]